MAEQIYGMNHLYIGDGKGKTTAAVGLCARMAGAGRRVLFFQFLKSGESSEVMSLQKLGVETGHTPKADKFTWQMDTEEFASCQEAVRRCFAEVLCAAQSGDYGLIVLDEVLDAVNCRMLEDESLQRLLRDKAPVTELVLTGRNPSEAVAAKCDYISEIKCVRHPYQKGITARKGVEY
ncbi:cob(I)yrinic acid a,c-diamide adenosyltransferase [Zongyangia hominis]|uniref:Cob(I)yrinic acid a,c-diamide adenosyltransferase n=1 Tax=Zongyangia hominis TaxID=2763677 RepID=A0A926EFS0_9FIRM|nr:cob(I)yrinic acid a,c-diamide adenosyltransferase [Zongyangia hominis]MBC8571031.1 cob(I)yrinic acid a,c-diamide adenosyltransferase [Zongyangia hominis]